MFASVKRQTALLIMLALLMPLIAACGGTATTGSPTSNTSGGTAATAETASAAPEAPEATAKATSETGATAEATAEATSAATAEATSETTATAEASGAMVELPEVDPASVTGDIVTAGSSTVFPVMQRMAELFREDGYAGTITVDSVGTGAGFERFCNGETDIANASRAIKEDEVQACQANGIEPVEFRVGTDALSVVVSAENDFIDNITLEQLRQIFEGEITTWSQLDPSYPNETIQLFSPGTDSGTFDYFVEAVLEDDAETILTVPGIQLSENDNVLAQGVQGSPYAIGYFGFAYFEEYQDSLKALTIDGVEPNAETAEGGEYPLARPLFIYSSENVLQEKQQVADLINYILTNINDEILDVGYFPASEEAINEAKQNLLTATGQ